MKVQNKIVFNFPKQRGYHFVDFFGTVKYEILVKQPEKFTWLTSKPDMLIGGVIFL